MVSKDAPGIKSPCKRETEYGSSGEYVFVKNPGSSLLIDILRHARKYESFRTSKSPTGNDDSCFVNCQNDDITILSYPYDITIGEEKLIAIIESMDDAMFKKHSREETIDRVHDCFMLDPKYHVSAVHEEYDGCTGVKRAIDDDDVRHAVIDAMQPKSRVPRTSACDGTCETLVARYYNVYFTFDIIVTVEEMMAWLDA